MRRALVGLALLLALAAAFAAGYLVMAHRVTPEIAAARDLCLAPSPRLQ